MIFNCEDILLVTIFFGGLGISQLYKFCFREGFLCDVFSTKAFTEIEADAFWMGSNPIHPNTRYSEVYI